MSAANAAHDDHHGLAHTMSPKMLIGIWAALIGLTGLTVLTASMHLHPFDLVIAMVIATVKALLVALFFMHLLYDRPFNGLVFMLSFVFAAVFVTFSMFDTGNNQTLIAARSDVAPVVEKWRAAIDDEAAEGDMDYIRGLVDGSVPFEHEGHGEAAEGAPEDAGAAAGH
jgi:cytochrome c oxidase subunit IV